MLNCDTTNAKTHVECIVIGYSFELIEEIEEMTTIASLLPRPCSDPLHAAPSAQSGLWAAIVLFISGSRHFYSYHHQIKSAAATDN